MSPLGLEPRTNSLKGYCSNQLSYGPLRLENHFIKHKDKYQSRIKTCANLHLSNIPTESLQNMNIVLTIFSTLPAGPLRRSFSEASRQTPEVAVFKLDRPLSYCYKYNSMNTTILQIPMPKSLKKSAQEVASEYGFSSLQDLLRVILTKLSRRELIVSIESPVYLSRNNKQRYIKMSQDFAQNKNVKDFSSVKELIKDLNS